MLSLEEMVSKGKSKLDRKADQMGRSWTAAKERMKSGYARTPFGTTRKSNYNSGIDAASFRTDNEKWARNWAGKMKE